jgi:hypothetical protein
MKSRRDKDETNEAMGGGEERRREEEGRDC